MSEEDRRRFAAVGGWRQFEKNAPGAVPAGARWLATESAAALTHDGDGDGFCIPGCPDDVCRMSGHCAWPPVSPGKAGE